MMKVIYIFGLIAQVYFVQCRREDKVCMDNLKFCIPVSLFLWDKIFTFFSQYHFFKLLVFPMIFVLEEAKMVLVIQRMFESKFLNKIHSKWKQFYSYLFREECSNRGGKNDGSCAQGYGVCCTCRRFLTIFLKINNVIFKNCI